VSWAVSRQLSNAVPEWLTIEIIWVEQQPGSRRVPFNEAASAAKDFGADYFVRVNDDTEFVTGNWVTHGSEDRHTNLRFEMEIELSASSCVC
jgi:hypothetical protein